MEMEAPTNDEAAIPVAASATVPDAAAAAAAAVIPEDQQTSEQKRKEAKFRRRDTRCIANILKAVNALSEKERFEQLKAKYEDLYEFFRATNTKTSLLENRIKVIQHNMDTLQNEHTKSLLARARLESLCRELQKQNKIIREENLAKIKQEEEMRKEYASHFQTTFSEISNMLKENNEKNTKLRDDNQDMARKIATLCKDFERGEQEIDRMQEQMKLEKKLSEATLKKVLLEVETERQVWSQERDMLTDNLKKSEETCTRLQTNIKALQDHLQMYTGKYEEFETTMNKSNQAFDVCKNEISKLTKQNIVMDKELKVWKSRSDHYAKIIVELSASKQVHDAEMINSEKKIEQLQKLCRQLQVDRAAYLKLLKSHSIEPPSQICVDTANPAPPPPPPHKPTAKEQELAAMKSTLKSLEEQVNLLTSPLKQTDDANPKTDNILLAEQIVGVNGMNEIQTTEVTSEAQPQTSKPIVESNGTNESGNTEIALEAQAQTGETNLIESKVEDVGTLAKPTMVKDNENLTPDEIASIALPGEEVKADLEITPTET